MQIRWMLCCLAVALSQGESQTPGEIKVAPAGSVAGSVADARGGEALANVTVQLAGTQFRAVTDSSGHFRISAVPAGDYSVHVSTVGYHLVKREFHLEAGETKEFAVVLSSDNFHQTDTVEGKLDPFDTARQDNPGSLTLAGNDVKNLGSVLADDPLRAVQGLPGVSSNNDFDARFSLRGADYSRIGLYLDGVLLHEPFHMLQGQAVSGSGTAFNGDMVSQLDLYEGAYPVRYDDRSAGALDVQLRDGNRSATTFRVAASASNAGIMAEGPLGRKKRGSWMVATRKSYLQYILARTFPNTSLIFGLEDVQGRAAYDLTPKHNFTFYVLESYSNLDRSSARSTLGINSLMEGGYHYTLANLGWRYTPNSRLILVNHAAWMREKYDNSNPSGLPLGGGYYGEWVWNSTATWMWNSNAPLEAGWSVRQLRGEGFSTQYLSGAAAPRLLDRFNGNALRLGGYVQQSWNGWKGRLHLTAGVRWDRESIDGMAAVSPQASLNFLATKSTHLQLGFGQYVQYPELSLLTSPLGGRGLLPMRSNQVIAAVEQRLGPRTRLRLEYYNRADRDLPFQPLFDPRMIGPLVFSPPLNPLYTNSLRGYSRGAEMFLQRSSANRATGWVSYSYGHTGMRDGVTGSAFPSDYDQRHTLNVYGSYRLRPTVNLSLRWSYGSAFPIPGYLRLVGTAYYLSTERNQLRLPAYQRTDFRVNKAWAHDKWKMTLYGEVINLTNRTNYVYDSLNGYNTKTGLTTITLDKMFPVLPSAGLVFER